MWAMLSLNPKLLVWEQDLLLVWEWDLMLVWEWDLPLPLLSIAGELHTLLSSSSPPSSRVGKVFGFFLLFREVLGVDESFCWFKSFEGQWTPESVSSSGLDPVIMLFVPKSTGGGGGGFWLVGCSRLSHDPVLSRSMVAPSSPLFSEESIPIRSTNAIWCPLSLSIFTTLFTSHPTYKREHKCWNYATVQAFATSITSSCKCGGGSGRSCHAQWHQGDRK